MLYLKSFLLIFAILVGSSADAQSNTSTRSSVTPVSTPKLEMTLDVYANLVDTAKGTSYQVGADSNNGTIVKFKMGLGVKTFESGGLREFLNVLNFKSDTIKKTMNGRTFEFVFYSTVRLVTYLDKNDEIQYGGITLENKTEVDGKIWKSSVYQGYDGTLEHLVKKGGLWISMKSEIDPSTTIDLGNDIIMKDINVDLSW